MVVTTASMLAHVLREFRYQQNLSQSELARLAMVKQATISAFENNPDSTKIETLFKLLTALELEFVIQPRPKGDEVIERLPNGEEMW